MSRKVLSVCCIVGGLMWGIIISTGVMVWELFAPETDPGLVKSLILVIVCCVLIIAFIVAIAVMDNEQSQRESHTRNTPQFPAAAAQKRLRRLNPQ